MIAIFSLNSNPSTAEGISFSGMKRVLGSKSLSARNFLTASIAIAWSMVPRVQASSQRLLQIRPQTAGKGLFFLIKANASS